MVNDYFVPIYCILPKKCVVKEISISKRWIRRNAGIAEAKGQFIHMCDADDWVTPTFLEIIATKAIGDIGIASQVPDIG